VCVCVCVCERERERMGYNCMFMLKFSHVKQDVHAQNETQVTIKLMLSIK
jgi:hypothetical protein